MVGQRLVWPQASLRDSSRASIEGKRLELSIDERRHEPVRVSERGPLEDDAQGDEAATTA